MNTASLTRKLTLSAVSVAALAGGTMAMPHAAHAADGGSSPTVHAYSKTLTFTLSTTFPAPGGNVEREMKIETGDGSNAAGGNVEYEWKVEEGESAIFREVSGLKVEADIMEVGSGIKIGVGELQECTISKSMDASGAGSRPKHGNVEFEWKVEEGES